MMNLWNGGSHIAPCRPIRRGDDPMHEHGPTELTGPLRGTRAWWQGTGALSETADDGAPVNTRTKKGKRMARGKRGGRRMDGDGVRPELVDRIRREIAAGTYDSQEKWEAALDRLLDRLERD
jgi:hypothetical protein